MGSNERTDVDLLSIKLMLDETLIICGGGDGRIQIFNSKNLIDNKYQDSIPTPYSSIDSLLFLKPNVFLGTFKS
jgi:hypothetical protein